MSNGFIPHFEALRVQSEQKSARFFRDIFFSLLVLLVVIILSIEVGLWGWLKIGVGENTAQILQLVMLMMPGILFICLFGLGAALLQCEKQFFLSGFAPVAFNAVWIAGIWWLKERGAMQAMAPLSVAIVLAFFMQWMMTAPKTMEFFRKALPLKEFFRPKLFSAEMRRVISPFFLGVAGIGAVQVNSTLDALFARAASLEGPAYLWYAIRIYQLPLALFGIALSSALLPSLSRAGEAADWEKFRELLHSSLIRCLSFILPATFALFVGGAAIVNLLYGHGDFTQTATYETLLCLWGYIVGLIPAVFVLLLAPAFYARKDFRLPTKAAILSVLLNVLLNTLLVYLFHWGASAIAVATSVAAAFNFLYLKKHLQQHIGSLFDRTFLRGLIKISVATLSASTLTLFAGYFFFNDPTLAVITGKEVVFSTDLSAQMLHCGALGLLFLSSLIGFAWLVRSDEMLQLLGIKTFQRQSGQRVDEQE